VWDIVTTLLSLLASFSSFILGFLAFKKISLPKQPTKDSYYWKTQNYLEILSL